MQYLVCRSLSPRYTFTNDILRHAFYGCTSEVHLKRPTHLNYHCSSSRFAHLSLTELSHDGRRKMDLLYWDPSHLPVRSFDGRGMAVMASSLSLQSWPPLGFNCWNDMHNNLWQQHSVTRGFSSGCLRLEKEKSKVEQTVSALKESLKVKKEQATIESASADVVKPVEVPVLAKKTIVQRVVAEIKHYYHGFRLLFIDISISARLLLSILRGKSLTRREHKLLVRTVSDIFRLVPFSVFIIVPFMELLLPVFIKLFPGMLPSTFQSSDEHEAKMKKSLKMKLEMAKFLQDTLDEMDVTKKGDKRSDTAKEFSLFFEKVRSSGVQASNEQIIRFSKLFEDEITLDSLNRPQLIALCKLLELQTFGTSSFLSFQLRMRLRSLNADDKIIHKEGVESLNTMELQQACKARGMRAYGVSDERMRSQMEQWLELSLDDKIPPSLLLLSRALYIPDNLAPVEQLKATISSLPDSVATQAKAKIGEIEGKVDNKTRIDVIRDEQKQIKREQEERAQLEQVTEVSKGEAKIIRATVDASGSIEPAPTDGETLLDTAPILKDSVPDMTTTKEDARKKALEAEEISSEDLDVIEDALENIAQEKRKLLIEKEELQDLKEDMAEYKEDIEELQDVVAMTGGAAKDLKINKASLHLYKQVNRMIGKMDGVIGELEKRGSVLKEKLEKGEVGQPQKAEDELVSIDEVLQAMRQLQNRPSVERLKSIASVLEKMDDDHDGIVKVDDVLQIIELVGKDDVKLTSKQVNEIINLLEKEETLEFTEKVEKLHEREEQRKLAAEATKQEQVAPPPS